MRNILSSVIIALSTIASSHPAFATYPCVDKIVYQAICRANSGFLRVDKVLSEQNSSTDKQCLRAGKISLGLQLMTLGEGRLTESHATVESMDLDLSREDNVTLTFGQANAPDGLGRILEQGIVLLPSVETENENARLHLTFTNGEREVVELFSCMVKRN